MVLPHARHFPHHPMVKFSTWEITPSTSSVTTDTISMEIPAGAVKTPGIGQEQRQPVNWMASAVGKIFSDV